ncbi:helix-turn-helix domain-containing protein [Paracidovorax wautersii]|uniref:helix-turn-helix domain-containing protein n=1 Tax=Paracidovorax wautersii TaxID=1177982 RepID=UPI00336A7B7A
MRRMSTTLQNLKRLRASGLSQSEISRRAGIPQPRLSRWERGDVAKAADDAIRLDRLANAVCGGESADRTEEAGLQGSSHA